MDGVEAVSQTRCATLQSHLTASESLTDLTSGVQYYLDRLPDGYALFERPRPGNAKIVSQNCTTSRACLMLSRLTNISTVTLVIDTLTHQLDSILTLNIS